MTPLATALDRRVRGHLHNTCVITPERAELRHFYQSLAHAVRDRLVDRWHHTQQAYEQTFERIVEFLETTKVVQDTEG